MPITISNSSKNTVRSAGIDFKPGENKIAESALSAAKLVQIHAAPALTVHKEPAVTSVSPEKAQESK